MVCSITAHCFPERYRGIPIKASIAVVIVSAFILLGCGLRLNAIGTACKCCGEIITGNKALYKTIIGIVAANLGLELAGLASHYTPVRRVSCKAA